MMAGTCDTTLSGWSLQLQNIDPSVIQSASAGLIVIDQTRTGHFESRFSAEELARMRQRPGKPPRLLLAYLSIGEAESYRDYWQADWKDHPPAWLGPENPGWPGNFAVRYWDPAWQRLIYGAPTAMLDRIIADGYDGVMLDRVDASEYWRKKHPKAAAEMADMVEAIASYARQKNPMFLIAPLNSENLLGVGGFTDAIDVLIKEDLFYGLGNEAKRNPKDMVKWSLDRLKIAKARGIPVLVVEYLPEGDQRKQAAQQIDRNGFLGTFGARSLDALTDSLPAPDGQVISLAQGAACRR